MISSTLDEFFALRRALATAGGDLSPSMRLVLFALTSFRDRDGGIACSIDQLVAVTGAGRATVTDSLRELRRVGVVRVEHRHAPSGRQLPSAFTLALSAIAGADGATPEDPAGAPSPSESRTLGGPAAGPMDPAGAPSPSESRTLGGPAAGPIGGISVADPVEGGLPRWALEAAEALALTTGRKADDLALVWAAFVAGRAQPNAIDWKRWLARELRFDAKRGTPAPRVPLARGPRVQALPANAPWLRAAREVSR